MKNYGGGFVHQLHILAPPMDQGAMGCCSAVAIAQCLAAMVQLIRGGRNDTRRHPSVQELVNKVQEEFPKYCDEVSATGGFRTFSPEIALDYIMLRGVLLEAYQSYCGRRTLRPITSPSLPRLYVHKYEYKAALGNDIRPIIRQHPIVGVFNSYSSLDRYKEGTVYQGAEDADDEKTIVRHAVVIFGYGNDKGQDFYWIQNSWGARWGYNGIGKVSSQLFLNFVYPNLEGICILGMDTRIGYYFTNLMKFDSSQEQLMMEPHSFHPNAQVLTEETQASHAMGSILKKPKRGGNFTVEEDKLLVSAWLNISMDQIPSTDQKRTTFWQRVKEFIQQNEPFETNRTTVSLQSRWSKIQLSTNKFCSCYAKIEALNQSGINQEDKVRKAKALYKETFDSEFRFDHCWVLLKNQLKWHLESEKKNQAKKPRLGLPSCPPTPDTINIDDNVTTDNFVDLQRPPDTEVSKAQSLKRKNREIVSRVISLALDCWKNCLSN